MCARPRAHWYAEINAKNLAQLEHKMTSRKGQAGPIASRNP